MYKVGDLVYDCDVYYRCHDAAQKRRFGRVIATDITDDRHYDLKLVMANELTGPASSDDCMLATRLALKLHGVKSLPFSEWP